ncbi:MAG: sulfatase [Planctomycetota bacterium]
MAAPRRSNLRSLTVLTLALIPLACQGLDAPGRPSGRAGPPNVLVIFTDDQGYGDVGAYGARGFATPNIDRIARQGVRFTDFYVSQPVCSASRASLLTGCYANRVGIHGALGPKAKHGLHPDELTLAEVCKRRGYATAAYGKWHLGHLPQFLPTRHGFDEFYGIPYSNDMGPGHAENPDAWPPLPTFEGEQVVGLNTDQSRFTQDFTERAVRFIEGSAKRGVPFFVYLAHPMPHVPLAASPAFRDRTEQGLYGDVIAEIDDGVGRLLETLARLGLSRDTLVVYASDNGPWLNYGNHAGSTGPLREGKGTTFEGGVRVPCVMRWLGQIPAGSVCREPVMTIDLLPTVARLLDVDLPNVIDGHDIWPLLRGDPRARSPHEALFFYYHNNHLEAMRSDRWKLHFPHGYRSMVGQTPGREGAAGPYDWQAKTELALFDLAADLGEEHNVAARRPDVVRRLELLAEKQRQRLGDELQKVEGTENRAPGR